MEKGKYKTQHKEELQKYLSNLEGEHFTVADLVSHFREEGRPIGTTTIYRQLERLCEEGLVNKYLIDQNSPACFEYVGERKEASKEHLFFHCKCSRCGALIHLHCHELDFMMEHLLVHHGFHWNPKRTVFYGLCENCAREEEKRP